MLFRRKGHGDGDGVSRSNNGSGTTRQRQTGQSDEETVPNAGDDFVVVSRSSSLLVGTTSADQPGAPGEDVGNGDGDNGDDDSGGEDSGISTPSSSSSTSHPRSSTSLQNLPAELLPHIAAHLPWPDALALRHTHPRFLYTSLLYPSCGKPAKIDWLVARGNRALPIPQHNPLRLDTDATFCANPEVRRIMIRRRRHAECEPGPQGCTVIDGHTCGGPLRRSWIVAWSPTLKAVVRTLRDTVRHILRDAVRDWVVELSRDISEDRMSLVVAKVVGLIMMLWATAMVLRALVWTAGLIFVAPYRSWVRPLPVEVICFEEL